MRRDFVEIDRTTATAQGDDISSTQQHEYMHARNSGSFHDNMMRYAWYFHSAFTCVASVLFFGLTSITVQSNTKRNLSVFLVHTQHTRLLLAISYVWYEHLLLEEPSLRPTRLSVTHVPLSCVAGMCVYTVARMRNTALLMARDCQRFSESNATHTYDNNQPMTDPGWSRTGQLRVDWHAGSYKQLRRASPKGGEARMHSACCWHENRQTEYTLG